MINSTESATKPVTSSQLYQWKPKAQNDYAVSSPSLIRPTIATPPRVRKEFRTSTEMIGLGYSNRMKEDKLFEMQR